MDEEFILKIMHQLVSALQECHRRKDGAHVLHRDLKPANVFLDSSDNVKLGDFGLARVLQHDTSFAKTFVGTPYYMSPVSNIQFILSVMGTLGAKESSRYAEVSRGRGTHDTCFFRERESTTIILFCQVHSLSAVYNGDPIMNIYIYMDKIHNKL